VRTGRAERQSLQLLLNYLTTRSAGRSQGRRKPARAARETLTADGAEAIARYASDTELNSDTVGLNHLSDRVSALTR